MPAKKPPGDKNRKLTDFFQKTPASVSAASSPVGSKASRMTPVAKSPVASQASQSTVGSQSPMKSGAPSRIRNTSTIVPRKRARSPDGGTSLRPTKSKLARKSLDSPCRMATSCVSSPLSRTALVQSLAPEQAYNNSIPESPGDISMEIICSGQSDEAELALPSLEPQDPNRVVENVRVWARRTLSKSSPSRLCEDAMQVDVPPSSPPQFSSPLSRGWDTSPPSNTIVRSTAISKSSPQTPITVSSCLPSPPDTDGPPLLPPTPIPIDPDVKTAKIIAEIKARAKAFAAQQSSDNETLSFPELEDSDDDEIVDALPLVSFAKERSPMFPVLRTQDDIFSSPLSSVPSPLSKGTCRTSDLGSAPRTSERVRKLAPPFRLPTTVAESSLRKPGTPDRNPLPRKSARICKSAAVFCAPMSIAESPTSVKVAKRRASPHKNVRTANPLQALLREKQLQDKRGTNSAAVRLAEEAIRQNSPGTPANSDDGKLDRFADEQLAWKAVYESRKSTSPVDADNVANFTIGDRELQMLGVGAGEAINKIIAVDKSKGKERTQDVTLKTNTGIPLWIEPSHEDMEVDSSSLPPISGHPILSYLDDLLGSGDEILPDLILRTGVLAVVPTDVLISNMSQLLGIFFFASSQIASAISIAFRDLWTLHPQKMQIPFTAVLSTLVQLCANPLAFEELGWDVESTRKNNTTHEIRLGVLKRLLGIMKAASSVGAIAPQDIADVVLVLVIVGLGPMTSDDLFTQMSVTLDTICNSSPADNLLDNIHERVLNFARHLAPIIKVRLASFFASGSGRTRRIAQRLAYHFLVPAASTQNNQVPPLEPLILLLSPDAGSRELFDVTNRETDYEELGHYVNLISVALTDIGPYVDEEQASTKSGCNTPSRANSTSKTTKAPTPPLELLRKVLEVLQSKIVDTRAAHLDRSRTKAAIQRLTMRINYGRRALTSVRPRQRTSTLKAYFSPQRS